MAQIESAAEPRKTKPPKMRHQLMRRRRRGIFMSTGVGWLQSSKSSWSFMVPLPKVLFDLLSALDPAASYLARPSDLEHGGHEELLIFRHGPAPRALHLEPKSRDPFAGVGDREYVIKNARLQPLLAELACYYSTGLAIGPMVGAIGHVDQQLVQLKAVPVLRRCPLHQPFALLRLVRSRQRSQAGVHTVLPKMPSRNSFAW